MKSSVSRRWAGSALVLAVMAGSAWGQVRWQSGADAARPASMQAPQLRSFIAEHVPAIGGRRLVVRLTHPITDQGRAELTKRGLTILAPLNDLSFFATLAAGADAPGLAGSGWIDHVRTIDTAWKVHPAIVRGARMPWAEVSMPKTSSSPAGESLRAEVPDGLAVYIVLHEDVQTDAAATAMVESLGGIVRGAVADMRIIVAELPKADILTLAGDDRVQWIEPAMPQFNELNAENRALTQANQVQASPYNLDGTGVKVFVYDGGSVLTTHQDLAGRVVSAEVSVPSVSDHSTHVAGTIGGTGAASGGQNRGMAPGVTFLSGAFTTVAGTQWLYNNVSDLVTDYTRAYTAGAQISNNSIGTNTAPNGFDCEWEGNYGEVAGTLDSLVRGDLSVTNFQPFRVCWAAGNERSGSARCGSTYKTTAPPAGAKNTIVVGAVNANDDSMTSFSSWGPMEDGRMRPDISAPGCQVGGDGGVTSCGSASNTAYITICGTSMATPTVTGCSALIMQDWRTLRPGAPDPRNSTLKVLLAHTAVDRGNPGPDYQFGYGSIRVKDAIDHLRTGRILEDTVAQGGSAAYKVTVPPGTPNAKFTVAWDDPRATGNIVTGVINNLDLVVIDPSGQRQYPFTLDRLNPGNPAVRTAENTLDNIEQVSVDSPLPGEWLVQVRGTVVPTGPQPFSIASSHDLTGGVPVPSISVSATTLAPGLVAPATGVPVSCTVIPNAETIATNGVKLLYRTAGSDPWSEVVLSNTTGSLWEGVLPGFACATAPEYKFFVTGNSGTTGVAPNTGVYTTTIGVDVPLFADDFETSSGWVGGQVGDTAVAGKWVRMAPQQTTNPVNGVTYVIQPGTDHTPGAGTTCWVTDGIAGAAAGSGDVDNGFTTLLSAPFDLAGKPDAVISYYRWYSNAYGGDPGNDTMPVQISNNGTTWVNVETVGPSTDNTGGWIQHSFRVGDFLPTPSSAVRLRFIAQDLGTGGLIEALVDDFLITIRECVNPSCPCAADFNASGGTPDVSDIDAFFTAWLAGASEADVDCSGGTPGTADISEFFTQWLAGGC